MTGHTGFKGSWLSFWLNSLGAKVCGYSLLPETNPNLFENLNLENLIESKIGDIRDLSNFSQTITDFQPEIVFHLAAQPLVRRSYREPIETYTTNVIGTINILEAIRSVDSVKSVVIITTKGCGNENNKVTFSVPLQESGAFAAGQSYIGTRNDEHEGKENQVRWQGTKDVECEIVKIDDFLPNLQNLSLIKADVEGAELFAFQGAEKIIDQHLPTIICEINPWFLDGFGVKITDLTDFFLQKGYKMFFYKDGKLSEVEVKDVVEDNYLFIHQSKFDKFNGLIK